MTGPPINACPIFQGFSLEEYEQVLKLLDQKSYENGTEILREGESQQALWIVVRGTCEVVKELKDGQEKGLATLEAGAVFGEISFFHKAPHSATVRALTSVRVMVLSREKYEVLRESCPAAAHKITVSVVCSMAERLRRMDEWIGSLLERPEAASHQEEWRDFRAKLYADWQF
jgi:CRP-like cAMP-binding protein